jgi:hypothetical protein
MRVANVRTRIKFGHSAAEANPAAFDDVGAVGDQSCEVQILLGDDD